LGIEDYNRLIEAFCASQGIDDVGAMLHRGFVDIDDVSMQVEYLEASHHCRVLADLGEIPAEHESELCEFMLEFNFGDSEYGLPVLSIHPDTGRAVLAVHLPLGGMLADGLMQSIERHVQPRIEWWNDVIAQLDETPFEDIEPALRLGAYA
jgi:Tir chaperone protein (CesT) family